MADFFDRLMVDAKKAAKKAAATVADRTAAASQIAKNKTRETMDGVKLEIEIKKVRAVSWRRNTRCWAKSYIR